MVQGNRNYNTVEKGLTMRKQFLGNLIRVQLLSSFMGIMICTLLYGMDANSELCDFTMHQVVIHFLNHEQQRQCARLNTLYNKVVEERYRSEKKDIDSQFDV